MEVKPRGFFVSTGMDYKCLFYNNRTCHAREQIDITDERLRKEIIVGTEVRDQQLYQGSDAISLKQETRRLVADWLVNEFCRICPHREA